MSIDEKECHKYLDKEINQLRQEANQLLIAHERSAKQANELLIAHHQRIAQAEKLAQLKTKIDNGFKEEEEEKEQKPRGNSSDGKTDKRVPESENSRVS